MTRMDERLDGSVLELRYERGIYSFLIDGENMGQNVSSMQVDIEAMMPPRLTVFQDGVTISGGLGAVKRALLGLREPKVSA